MIYYNKHVIKPVTESVSLKHSNDVENALWQECFAIFILTNIKGNIFVF